MCMPCIVSMYACPPNHMHFEDRGTRLPTKGTSRFLIVQRTLVHVGICNRTNSGPCSSGSLKPNPRQYIFLFLSFSSDVDFAGLNADIKNPVPADKILSLHVKVSGKAGEKRIPTVI